MQDPVKHYRIVYPSAGKIEVKRTPVAVAGSLSAWYYGFCSVYYHADVSPVSIQGSSGSSIGGSSLVIGQRMTAQVTSSMSSPADTYTWRTPSGGAPFSNYQASNSGAHYTPFSVPPITSSTMSCYFAKPGTPTISCVYYSAYAGQSITLSISVPVVAPGLTAVQETCGAMKLLDGNDVWAQGYGSPDYFRLWGSVWTSAEYGSSTWGMWDVNRLKDPSFAPGGLFGYVQLKNRTSTLNSAPPEVSTGLDGNFSYNIWANANGVDYGVFNDSPGRAVGPPPFSFSYDGTYKLYMMYKPVDNGVGPSVYVPIFKTQWQAKGACSSPLNGPWIQQDNGSRITSRTLSDGSSSAFPEW